MHRFDIYIGTHIHPQYENPRYHRSGVKDHVTFIFSDTSCGMSVKQEWISLPEEISVLLDVC